MSAADFAIQIDRAYAEEVEGQLLRITKKVAMETLSRVVLKTPVDTGRARGNWHVSVGSASQEVTERTDPSGSTAINEGTATIGAMPSAQIVYVQNNLPYIERLENGHSKQAPAGMAALTVAEIEVMFT